MKYLPAIIFLSALVAILLGVTVLDGIATRDAQLTEYEFLVAELWSERNRCINQLGVFYKPTEKEVKTWNKNH